MSDEIVNRVAQSSLITFNLEDYYQEGKRVEIDMKDWLFQEFVLKEKEFRHQLLDFDFSPYKDAFIALHCSTDAIVPTWAYMLLTSYLQPFAKKIVHGSLQDLENALYQSAIENIDVSPFVNKSVIVKGCSKKQVPLNAYLLISYKLQPVVKSLMYGEACSAVPLYKSK